MTQQTTIPELSSDHLAIINTACRHIYQKHNGQNAVNQPPLTDNIAFYKAVDDYLIREYGKPMLEPIEAKAGVFQMWQFLSN